MVKKIVSPDNILKSHNTSIRKISNELRKIISSAVPEISEKALPGWHAIGFRHVQAGHICAVFPFESIVKLYFEYGAKLADPDHVLEGNTKQTRFISFSSPSDISPKKIQKLVKESILYLTG
ncbi:MAG: DUF1801 domain-containing protein [Thaumarchaeota archaeon]|nr:DUF1801 domain-containing protein [Nitrososphaerota archaeon]